MKRVLKFNHRYVINGWYFSEYSTNYELFPYVVDDDAGDDVLMEFIKKLNLRAVDEPIKIETPTDKESFFITNAVKEGTISTAGFFNKASVSVYLGFITIPESDILPVKESLGNKLSYDQACEIVKKQDYGVVDSGITVDGDGIVIRSGPEFYHALPMNGYDLNSFKEVLGITLEGLPNIYDRCNMCFKYESRYDGRIVNFHHTPDGDMGIKCGCYDIYCKENLDKYIGVLGKPIPLHVAEELESEGVIEHVEQFIREFTDDPGDSWRGEICKEGDPIKILKWRMEEDPKSSYLTSEDTRGPFKNYFSLWKVVT
jgi:hypothetical protein